MFWLPRLGTSSIVRVARRANHSTSAATMAATMSEFVKTCPIQPADSVAGNRSAFRGIWARKFNM